MLYTSPPGRPVHSKAISTSLGSIQPRCNCCTKAIRSHIHHCLYCETGFSRLRVRPSNRYAIAPHKVIRCSSYYDIDKFTILANSNTNSFSILSSNIQSINAKFNELEMFVEDLRSINFKFSVICLQETWKADNDDFSQFFLDGYDCITQGKKCSNKGGLLIYVDNKYKSEVKMNLNTYEHWEGLMIKVTGNNLSKTMTIGNIYRPPRTCNENITKFIDEFSSVISSLENSNNNLIIAGDFNINLLKISENRIYSDFFDTLISQSLPSNYFPNSFH